MQSIQELDQISPGSSPKQDVVLTLGVFDGVHLGHRHLIGRTVQRARELGCLSAVIIFHPHPAAVVRGESLPLLTTPGERLRLMRMLDVDIIAQVSFTVELSRMTAREFVDHIRRHLRLRELWIGPDYALGKGREGNIGRLKEIGAEEGFRVQAVPPLEMDGEVVSSTRIRGLLARGDVSGAGRLLGHCFSFSGPVVEGARRGRSLGYPTANLAPDPGRALPSNGIYACRATVEQAPEAAGSRPGLALYQAVVSLGTRPTFDDGARLAEAHLLDFGGDLYGRTLTIHFVARLRDEMRFAGTAGLIEQIGRDVARTRDILATDNACALA